MNKQLIVVEIILVLFVVGLSGCTQNTSDNNGTNDDGTNSLFDKNQSNIPTYAGSINCTIPTDLKSNFKIPTTVDCTGSVTNDDPIDVLQWYKQHMTEWTLMQESNSTPPDKPESIMYLQYYKNNDDGVFLFLMDNFAEGKTLIGIVSGPWSSIQEYGFNETSDGGPQGSTNENGDVNWTNAYTVSDPAEDFWLGGGSPPQVINFPPSDIISINITNDETNLYIKFEMNGDIPTLPLTQDNDVVRILLMDVIMDADNNPSTGHVMNFNGGELAIEAWFGSPPQAQGTMYTFIHYAFYDPNGEEGVGTWQESSLVDGGVGTSSVTMGFPLADLQLQKGESIRVILFAEAESDAYHHYARDVINNDQWLGSFTIQ